MVDCPGVLAHRLLVIAAHRAVESETNGADEQDGRRTPNCPSFSNRRAASLYLILLRHTTPVIARVRWWLPVSAPCSWAVHSPLPTKEKGTPLRPDQFMHSVLPIAAAWHLAFFLLRPRVGIR